MRKRTVKGLLAIFVVLLISLIASFFVDFKVFSYVIYGLFGVNFVVLFVLFLKKSIKRWKGEDVSESKGEKVSKWIVYLIPIAIFSYVAWINVNPIDEITFYDVGSDKLNYFLYPSERVSENIKEGETTYKRIVDTLTYFNIEIPPNTKEVHMEIEFKANESEKQGLKIGGQGVEKKWVYQDVYKGIYTREQEWEKSKIGFNVSDLYNQKGELRFIIYNPKTDKEESPLYIKQIEIKLIK